MDGAEFSFAKKRDFMEFLVIAGHAGLIKGDPLGRQLLIRVLGCVFFVNVLVK